jgi:signal transduction histidine kinase
MVAIRVSDAGPGATEEFVPFLFDEFTRERGRSAQGTGLGLYVVRGLAIAQAGSVDYARIGDRTVFTIRLPSAAGSGHRHRVSDPAGDPAAAESSDD